jgi:hypothetical protein
MVSVEDKARLVLQRVRDSSDGILRAALRTKGQE